MDYSTLNRLKDKLEQATSAAQVASISAEIEKEERRIREAEEREERQKEALISSVESLRHVSQSLPLRQQVEGFIERGKVIMKEEYHHITEPGLAMPGYISGPKSDQWFSEIHIFNSRHFKKHPLHDQIEKVCKVHNRSYSAYDDMMGYLKALATDDAFWKEMEQKETTMLQNNRGSIAQIMLKDIERCKQYLDNPIPLQITRGFSSFTKASA
ncbi:MAG: hypothetical protein IJQ53_05700 [Clostridia bacterium]|nr:hypothetical protein [Clostridia bacterium]